MSPAPDLSLGPGVEDEEHGIRQCAVSDFDKECSYGSSHVGLSAISDHTDMFNVKVSDFGKDGCQKPCVRDSLINGGGAQKRRKRALGINCKGSYCCGMVSKGNIPDSMEKKLHRTVDKTPYRTYKNGDYIVCIPSPRCIGVSIYI